jgi:hypothetical protein
MEDLEEKKRQRSKRFGIPVVEKKLAPETVRQTENIAKVSNVSNTKKALLIHNDPEIVAKRKAKFGAVSPVKQSPVVASRTSTIPTTRSESKWKLT